MTAEIHVPGYARDTLKALLKCKLVVDKRTPGLTVYRCGSPGFGDGSWSPTGAQAYMQSGVNWLVENGLATNTLGLIEITAIGASVGGKL